MKRYLYFKHGECKAETRAPLKVLQMPAGNDNHQDDMSASRRYGLTNQNRVPKQNRPSRPVDSSKNPTKPSNLPGATKSSAILPKSKVCDKIPSLSKTSKNGSVSPDGSPLGTMCTEKTVNEVQSLMSSPKWSRIKDKFESNKIPNDDVQLNCKEPSPQNHNSHCSPKLLHSSKKSVSDMANKSITKPAFSHIKPIQGNKTNVKSRYCTKHDDKVILSVNGTAKKNESLKESLNFANTSNTGGVPSASGSLSRKISVKNITTSDVSATPLLKSVSSSSGCALKNTYSRKVNGYSSKPSSKVNSDVSSSLPVAKNNSVSKSISNHSSKCSVGKNVELSKRLNCSPTNKNESGITNCSSDTKLKTVSHNGLDLDSCHSQGTEVKENCGKKTSSQSLSTSVTCVSNKVLPSSQPKNCNKNLWVKDEFGNWTKNSGLGKNNTESEQSKVAILRSKFSSFSTESTSNTSHTNFLEKSKTTVSVPQTLGAACGKLSKSNTTSNVPSSSHHEENTCGSQKKVAVCDTKKKAVQRSSSSSSSSDNSEKTSPASDDKSPDQVRKLSLVQRAVLSYEENLSLLSPETQRRLKLLSEKVKAQNDDDNLLDASGKGNIFTSNGIRRQCSVEKNDLHNDTDAKENTDICRLGEPIQPVRNFLSRFNNMNKCKSEKKSVDIEVSNCSPRQHSLSSSSFLHNNSSKPENLTSVKKNNEDLSLSVKSLAKQFVVQNNLNNKSSTGIKETSAEVTKKSHVPGKSLHPNSSFLWRNSKNECSSVALKPEEEDSGSFHNYYVLENYYSQAENTKLVEDAQVCCKGNPPLKLTAGEARYQNVEQNANSKSGKIDTDDGWTDLSDEDVNAKSSSSRSSTLKRRKNKRHSHYRESLLRCSSQNLHEGLNTSVTSKASENSGNKKNNLDKNGYEDPLDTLYSDHLYEPVYESLGNYLLSDDNNVHEIPSPDDDQTKDVYSSCTSLESLHSDKEVDEHPKNHDKPQNDSAASVENPVGISKKATSKIRQLRRHLSWTKSDIKLELSSKFSKIKIKKNGHNGTEIGLKMQENSEVSTSPKKNTFIKCILKQKSCNNIPTKKLPSPKKESALFYVHLSMTQEKQRPFSDSCVNSIAALNTPQSLQESRKMSDTALSSSQPVHNKIRKRSSGQIIQRPKTPPPLPPTKVSSKSEISVRNTDGSSFNHEVINKDNMIYSECKMSSAVGSELQQGSDFTSSNRGRENYSAETEHDSKSSSLYATIDSVTSRRKRNSVASSTSYESYAMADESGSSGASSSTTYSSGFTLHIESNMAPFASRRSTGSHSSSLSLPLGKDFKNELLKSPFEEEPLYQFYHKDFQQRATLWYSTDGSESDDYGPQKLTLSPDNSKKPPLLQTQTSAMDLVHGEAGQRSLWCEVPEVRHSGILDKISSQDRKIQEAMFEVITSEASYLKSLNFLLEHFVQCPEFLGDSTDKHVLDKRERHILFSDIQPVRDVSASLLADLEKRWLENIVLSNVCDIIYNHASKYFSVYVKYCSNQIYQDRTLNNLKENRPQFVEVLKRLESNPVCQGLDMQSFLMLPMQRITRLPLLVDAIFHRLDIDSPIYESCKMALALLNKLVAECNEGARKMERMEQMLVISHQLDFKDCKGFGLLSASRWLVKKGELIQLVSDSNTKRAFGRNQRWCKIRLFVFLFTDLLVITKKKSDETYTVVDYCLRNMVQVMLIDENTPLLPSRLPSSYPNIFQLIMLSNSEGKTVEMLLSCVLESDRTRWMNAVTPPKSENPDEKIYEEWDCPQVQCTHAYVAQQPDELTIDEADVVNVFRKMSDGWFEGERIRDGVRGWFPSSHAMEIVSSHVRARNLRQRYRLLMLSQTYLEEQVKAQAAQSNKGK